MKKFFTKKKNIVILSIILAIVIVIAGIVCSVKNYNNKQEKVRANNQKAVIAQKSKTEILGEDKEETKKEYEEKYTEQYKKYLDLTDEEKEKTEVIPKKYEVNYNIINNIIEEQKEDTDTDTKNKDNTKTDIDYEFVTPKKFNLVDKLKIQVENQGDYGLCWDFAATKCLETNLALTKNKNYDFSEMHVNYVTSNLLLGDREINDGGNFSFYEDYLIDSGVVLEKDVEYKEYTENEYNKFLNLKSVVDVTKTVNFPTIYKYEWNDDLTKEQIETVRNTVKNHIMNYGSIYAEIAMDEYNSETNTLYTKSNSESWIDHAVTIVGWDDNYSKNNFPEYNRPENNGAYIALNSWGEDFGDKGYFYISYEDLYVESGMSGIVSTSYKDAYNLNDIENEEIKNVILQRLSNTIKEKDGKEYVTKLALSKINNIDLSETDIKTLKNIDLFENLYSLDLSKSKVENIKMLTKLKELINLNLSDTNVKDVSSLKENELYSLDLSNNKDVKGYDKIRSLGELYLSNCDVNDVSNLDKLEHLDTLDLSKNTNIKNIDKLNNYTNSCLLLKECNIKDINDIKNIKNIRNLNYIDLSYNNISNINGIEELENLTYIDLSGNKVKDFSNIALIGNEIDEEYNDAYITLIVENAGITDISLFNNLKNVSSLGLAQNNITDLSAFYNNSVYELDLSNNKKIYNIQYLRNLENLYALYLDNCNIQELSEISKLKNNIGILDLSNNAITSIDELNKLDLEALSLSGNNNIEGDLKIQTLNILNLANTAYDNEKFNFDDCSNLFELNFSGCNNINTINKILDSGDLDNIECIVLEKTDLTKEILEKIFNKQIQIYGANVNIKQSEHDDIINDEKSLSFKDSKVLRNIIKSSTQYRDLYIDGGKLNRNLYEIVKTSKNKTTTLYIDCGFNIYEVTINIDYLNKEEETTETEDKEDEQKTKNQENTQTQEKDYKDTDYEMVED